MPDYRCFLPDEAATIVAGATFAETLTVLPVTEEPLIVFLQGGLGAGKTTFSRGVIQRLGHRGAVKSPTYTLVEPYALPSGQVYHFDLYRLADAAELEYMGIGEYFQGSLLCLIEWSEKGLGWLPPVDLVVAFQPEQSGRNLLLEAHSERGEQVVKYFARQEK